MRRMGNRWLRGLTLVEMLVTLALVGVAASIVLPLASVMEARGKEAELRQALRTIRQALDSYKAAADSGLIDKPTGSSGYPPNLDILAKGVPRSTAVGIGAPPLILLRRVPRDPFFEDKTAPAAETWKVRSYGEAADVFDVTSRSGRTALDGSRYDDW
jgi:general secretion pathway protein G